MEGVPPEIAAESPRSAGGTCTQRQPVEDEDHRDHDEDA